MYGTRAARRGRQGGRGADDGGSVTAETAMVMPSLLLVLGMLLWGSAAASAQLRCIDAAREVARAVARGDDLATARQAAAPVAPRGAAITMWRSTGLVHVRVGARVQAGGALGARLGSIAVSGSAAAADEPLP